MAVLTGYTRATVELTYRVLAVKWTRVQTVQAVFAIRTVCNREIDLRVKNQVSSCFSETCFCMCILFLEVTVTPLVTLQAVTY